MLSNWSFQLFCGHCPSLQNARANTSPPTDRIRSIAPVGGLAEPVPLGSAVAHQRKFTKMSDPWLGSGTGPWIWQGAWCVTVVELPCTRMPDAVRQRPDSQVPLGLCRRSHVLRRGDAQNIAIFWPYGTPTRRYEGRRYRCRRFWYGLVLLAPQSRPVARTRSRTALRQAVKSTHRNPSDPAFRPL